MRSFAVLFSVMMMVAGGAIAQGTNSGVSFSFNQEGTASNTAVEEDATPAVATPQTDQEKLLQNLQAILNPPKLEIENNDEEAAAEQQARNQGSLSDPNSPISKALRLGQGAARQRADATTLKQKSDVAFEPAPPPDIETLQKINMTMGGPAGTKGNMIADDAAVSEDVSLDMRRDAQKEAALSYGARGGLAKRNYQIMERMRGFDPVLDRVFEFRALLVRAPSGLLIEPPIVREATDALFINASGDEAAVSDIVFNINKQAKIVSAPRDWRQYLIQSWSDVPPPPRILWPQNEMEQARWNVWVNDGWKAGIEQAEQIFESNLHRLVADYTGMVRYRMLLAQGMISAPYAMQEDRGVTGGKDQMRVGDRALRITGPSQFLTGSDLWKPADR